MTRHFGILEGKLWERRVFRQRENCRANMAENLRVWKIEIIFHSGGKLYASSKCDRS